jgi:hypothetical protein
MVEHGLDNVNGYPEPRAARGEAPPHIVQTPRQGAGRHRSIEDYTKLLESVKEASRFRLAIKH